MSKDTIKWTSEDGRFTCEMPIGEPTVQPDDGQEWVTIDPFGRKSPVSEVEILGFTLRQVTSCCPEQWIVVENDRSTALIHARYHVSVFDQLDDAGNPSSGPVATWPVPSGHRYDFPEGEREHHLAFACGVLHRHRAGDRK